VIVSEPPPKGFQTVALADIPDVIPPVDLTQRALDPRDFTGRGVEGGLAAGVVGGTGKADVWAGGPEPNAIYEASTIDERFAPATVIFQPAPRYPRHLESLGLEGRVLVEFVIDTAGQVEPASVRILESSHPAFEAAARAAIGGSRFQPARLSGHPVRQLTRQSVRFLSAQHP
jgi:TonB family protein